MQNAIFFDLYWESLLDKFVFDGSAIAVDAVNFGSDCHIVGTFQQQAEVVTPLCGLDGLPIGRGTLWPRDVDSYAFNTHTIRVSVFR